jgi:flagellar biosynthesis protein FlhA
MGTHLSELVRKYCHEIFSRQDTKRLLDRVAEEHPRVVEDLVPKVLPLPIVQRVLQNLLRERVSIRDSCGILEVLSEAASVTRNPILLTEYVRQGIRRLLVRPHLNRKGELSVFLLDSSLERAVEQAVEHGEHTSHLNLPPERVNGLLEAARSGSASTSAGWVLLTSTAARYFVRQILEARFPQVSVLSHGEIPAGIRVISLGVLKG